MQLSQTGLVRYLQKGKPLLNGALNFLYPPQCYLCQTELMENALCGSCWSKIHFISPTLCDCCGRPLIGPSDYEVLCDDCLNLRPIWDQGRAATLYDDETQRLILKLKNGDQVHLAHFLAHFMSRVGQDILQDIDLIVPVPLHWSRFLRRKFNQAALLGDALAKTQDVTHIPDALLRKSRVAQQKHMTREQRFENQAASICANPRYLEKLKGARVVVVDDVLTTGATLNACTKALQDAGCEIVNILVFARVAKRP